MAAEQGPWILPERKVSGLVKLAPAHQATAEPKFTSNRHQQAIMQAQFSSTQYWESCHNDVIAVWTMDSDFSTAWHIKFYDT